MMEKASALREKLPLWHPVSLQTDDFLPALFAFSDVATKVPLVSFQIDR
jgi:hypothetical protein